MLSWLVTIHLICLQLTPCGRLCSLPRCQNINPHGRPRLEKGRPARGVSAELQGRAVNTEKGRRPQGRRVQTAMPATSPTGSRPVRMRLTVTAVPLSPFPTTNSLRENEPWCRRRLPHFRRSGGLMFLCPLLRPKGLATAPASSWPCRASKGKSRSACTSLKRTGFLISQPVPSTPERSTGSSPFSNRR